MKISSPDLDSPPPLSGLPSVHYGQLPTANCASQDASLLLYLAVFHPGVTLSTFLRKEVLNGWLP